MRTCAFCPSTKLTQEHIWGDWINGVIPSLTFTTRRKSSPEDDAPKFWKTIGIQQTAGVVCQRCNNGWMSDLEKDEAKPIMADMIRYGAPVCILKRGVASISAWAFKMIVVANFVGLLKNQPYFSSAERYEFARTLRLPTGIQIWLFALNTPGRVTGRFNSHLGRMPLSVKYSFEMYIGTFALGYLGVQVVATRWSNPHISAFMGPFPGLREHNRWSGTTVPLFPPDGSPLVWPPPLHIGNDSMDEFCHRWKTMTIPTWMVDGALTEQEALTREQE